MKVNRQNISEEYSTTVDWVRDFSNGMTKSADYLSNLRSIMKKRKDFDTIEEKMADLKSRVGFDLVKTIDTNQNSNVKEAGCGCNSCGGCGIEEDKGSKSKKALANRLKGILRYIAEFSKDRPEAGYGAVITHCREHPELGFGTLEKRLNGKFEDAVRGIIGNHKKDPEAVEYIPGAEMSALNDDDTADYYSHANG